MIDAHRIIYNGLDSFEFDVTVHCCFDGDNGATSSFLNRDNIYTEHYDGRRTIHRTKYNEGFTPKFTIIKQDFSDFTREENRKILSWLTASEKPGWCEVYQDDSNVLSWKCFGNITSLEQYKLGNGRVIGYEFEIETTHPYAWSRKLETTQLISEPTTFAITCNTDEYNKLLYPKVTINFNGENVYVPINQDPTVDKYDMMPNVIYLYDNKYYIKIDGNKHQLGDDSNSGIFNSDITNQTASASTVNKYYYYPGNRTVYKGITIKDGDKETYDWEIVTVVGGGVQIENSSVINENGRSSKTILIGNAPGEQVILDGANKVVSSSITSTGTIGRIIGDDFNWIWVPLAEGKNNFTITGNCEVTFEWIEPRKVGSL